ncbi:MAG TPA: sterol desaturase family protein [Gemmatimonadales bacterium]|jgi:sterol desaturase/sphingolipid hydroxylase (fatty acid hydroxylase superfamily)
MDRLSDLAHRAGLAVLAQATGYAFLMYLVFSLLVLWLETRRGGRAGLLRSRAFMNDVLYALFYRGGLYAVFVWALLVNLFQRQLAFLQLGLLRDVPMIVSVPLYWLVGDFLFYWFHRLQHRVPALWAFHRVHHAAQSLNTFSQNRRHPVEYTLNSLVFYLPLAFVLGLSTKSWVPWFMTAQLLESLQHAQLDWGFGPLYRLVVSPVFHSIHHSSDPRHFNRNFGPMLSVWDYIFGTAAADAVRPAQYGIEGTVMPESLAAQTVGPFLVLARSGLRLDAPTSAAAVEPAPPL